MVGFADWGLQYGRRPKRRTISQIIWLKLEFYYIIPNCIENALRRLLGKNNAKFERIANYGVLFRVEGEFVGAFAILNVVTIWIQLAKVGQFRFVTLYPLR